MSRRGYRPGEKVRARYMSREHHGTISGIYPATVLEVGKDGTYLVRWVSLETSSDYYTKPSGVTWVDEDEIYPT